MTAKIIDGKKIAEETILEVKEKISKAKTKGANLPGLAVIQVGENPVSKIYVRNKRIACSQVGMQSFNYDLPANTSEKELIELVISLN
jgi:methylenetetrahydrofolate dehydrogenase (NADP+)/methenyltetrahydrofolate cyclohydrolase